MDRENYKRKATESPAKAAESSNNPSRGKKAMKPNPPEMQQQPAAPSQATGNSNGGEASRGSDLTQKLVAMWVAGTHGNHPFMTQEVRESMALRDAQQKSAEAEYVIQMLQNKMKNTESVMNDLNKSLKSEERLKTELVSKINLTGDLAATITDHINYITDTLQRCKQHKDHLSAVYEDIVVRQREHLSLKNREIELQKRVNILQAEISALEEKLQEARRLHENETNQVRRTFEAKLAKARDEYEKTRKQLEEVEDERKKMRSRLTETELNVVEMEKKIASYRSLMENLEKRVAESSASLESIGAENEQLKNQLAEKNREILEARENLKSATTEMSAMGYKNNELEERCKSEVDRRMNLEKSLEEARERDASLVQQVEKLRGEKEEAVREMRKLIDSAQGESKLLSEAKKEIQELVSNQEHNLRIQVEKYESCLVEMKRLETRHNEELARLRDSSDTSSSALQKATTENQKLEEAIGCLRQEKSDLQAEMQQIENLLKKHAISEKQLRVKLEQCQAEIERHVAAATAAQAEKKRAEDEKQEKICKIQDLEKELLNLQFNRSVITASEKSNSGTSKESDRNKRLPTIINIAVADRPKAKESAKKSPASATYKKSILKRDPKPRRTRSTPPSPVPVVAAPTAERKITFHFDSSSEGSPVKLPPMNVDLGLADNEVLFDDLVATGMSSSQPLQASQTYSSQRHPRKFFKSRASQSK